MTYNVARRTHEIGVRMALGAQKRGVQWMFLRESLLLLGLGVVVGVPATMAATRLVGAQFFGLTPFRPGHVYRCHSCHFYRGAIGGILSGTACDESGSHGCSAG